MADSITLPETSELAADTLLIANRVNFSGRAPSIKRAHDVGQVSVNVHAGLPAKQELEVQQEPLDQQEIRELEGMAAAFLVATRGATDWVAQEGMKEQAALAATLVAWASPAALVQLSGTFWAGLKIQVVVEVEIRQDMDQAAIQSTALIGGGCRITATTILMPYLPKIRVFGPITRRQIRSSASAGHVSRRGEIILAASKRGHGTSLCSLCCG